MRDLLLGVLGAGGLVALLGLLKRFLGGRRKEQLGQARQVLKEKERRADQLDQVATDKEAAADAAADHVQEVRDRADTEREDLAGADPGDAADRRRRWEDELGR